jgi:dTMP kinase
MAGLLMAFEGLDQSGKETQARLLADRLREDGRRSHIVTFPDDRTPLGQEIRRALAGGREYGPDVMQLLYVANRYERKPDLERWLADGDIVLCDRYAASSVAYGAAQGLDAGWLVDIQRFLPAAALTLLLDITPETAVSRKATGRDRFERDLALLARVRESYHRQADGSGWCRLDGERPRELVAADVLSAARARLSPR